MKQIGAALILVAIVGCKERRTNPQVESREPFPTPTPTKAESSDSVGIPSDPGFDDQKQVPVGQDPTWFDFCSSLPSLSLPASFGVVTNKLCSENLLEQSMRQSVNIYSGSGEPSVGEESQVLSGNRSQMLLYSSIEVRTKAQSYFNMMKLQLTKPNVFKTMFEVDASIEYDPKPQTSAQEVEFNYKNESMANQNSLILDYDALARFHVLVPGRAYVVSKEWLRYFATVRKFVGLVLIAEKAAGVSEVIMISDQTYDNNSRHDSTVREARNGMITEIKRSHRNGSKAHLADSH